MQEETTVKPTLRKGANMATTEQQNWSPEQYAKNARFVSDLGMPVVTLLAPHAGERILDVGCGDGPLTKAGELGVKWCG
jgi:2-polyprenyl-3-methyl-5-hydroxy-6-metoxy-1,4-benzoquinol methylase